MSIKINADKCTGCGKCTRVCPGNLISQGDDRKATIKYRQYCWGCAACLKECSAGAMEYYLGADIGGRGAYMYTRQEKDFLHWFIVRPNGQGCQITINRTKSNRY